MDPRKVSAVKESVRGKKYSALTKEEFDVLFADDSNLVSTVCIHNGIIDDSPVLPPKKGPKTGSKCPPKFKVEKPDKKAVSADGKPGK